MMERILILSFVIGIIGLAVRNKALPRIVSLIRIYPLYRYYIENDAMAYTYEFNNGVSFNIAFDGLSAFLTLMAIIIIPLIASIDESNLIGETILAEVAIIGVFLSRDAVLMMIFREISLVAILLMVLRTASKGTAIMYLAFAQAGALLALIPIFYGLYTLKTADMLALRSLEIPKKYVLAAVIGFGIEVPLFPLHGRFIRTLNESNVSTAVTLMFRNGIFGIFRIMYMYPITTERYKIFFRWGTISVFYAYLSAFGTDKIRELIAYLAMGHMSFARIAMPKLDLATTGALYYYSIHPLILAPLLMLAVFIPKYFETEHLLELKSYLHKPIFGFIIAISLLLSAAVPVSAGFVGEIITIIGMMAYGPIAILPVFAPVILMAVAVYYIREVLYGPREVEGKEIEIKHAIIIAVAIILAFIIVLRSAPIDGIKEVVSYV